MKFNIPEYDSNKTFEPFEALGFSLWMSQSLELSLVNYLVFAHKISPVTAKEQIQMIFEKTSKKTFGALLKELKMKDEFLSKTIIERLGVILDDRNWLIHKVYAINQSDMFSSRKSSNLIEKIRGIGFASIELSKIISKKTDEIIAAKGFSSVEELDKKTQEILNSWAEDK